jgi:hypothetical protein
MPNPKLRRLVEQIPATPHSLAVADNGDLAGVMWGHEVGYPNFIEVHNIVRAPTA